MSSAKVNSPAARLLRQSRLFAMPNPIPPPKSSIFNQSATSPYPVVQAITTTDASAHRGDWGLKRNLPLKTKVKHIGYTELDTMKHYTPFSTAENEVLLVKKWQEMDIPLAKASVNSFGLGEDMRKRTLPYNVFNSAFQLEMLEEAKEGKGGLELADQKQAKWDYKGPYLGTMTPGRLKAWTEMRSNDKTMREFLYFCCQRMKEYEAEGEQDAHLENSPAFRPRERTPSRAEVLASLKAKGKLPKDFQMTEDGKFPEGFKMPEEYKRADETAKAKKAFLKGLEGTEVTNYETFQYLRANPEILQLLVNAYYDIPTLPTGRTHPSAGLFYARSLAYMEYKPGVGGDISTKSLPGRFLYSRRGGTISGIAGVGGVVANANTAPVMQNSRTKNIDDVERIEHFTPGIDTIIDGDGAIQLRVNLLTTGPDSQDDMVGMRMSAMHRQALEYKKQQYNADYAKGQDLLGSVTGFSEKPDFSKAWLNRPERRM